MAERRSRQGNEENKASRPQSAGRSREVQKRLAASAARSREQGTTGSFARVEPRPQPTKRKAPQPEKRKAAQPTKRTAPTPQKRKPAAKAPSQKPTVRSSKAPAKKQAKAAPKAAVPTPKRPKQQQPAKHAQRERFTSVSPDSRKHVKNTSFTRPTDKASRRSSQRGSYLERRFPNPKVRRGIVAAVLIIAVLLVGGIVDLCTTVGHVHRGVSVAGVSLGGLTQKEAAQKLSYELDPVITGSDVVVYASEDDYQAHLGDPAAVVEYDGSAWPVTADQVGAHIDARSLASQAFEVGRGKGGFLQRLKAWFGGVKLDADVQFDEALLEETYASMLEVAGTPMINPSVVIQDGEVFTEEGQDGSGPTKEDFSAELADAFLSTDARAVYFERQPIPQQVEYEQAVAVAGEITKAISKPVEIWYDGQQWTIDPATLGTWTTTTVENVNGENTLVPHIDSERAKTGMEVLLGPDYSTSASNALFMSDDAGDVSIQPSSVGVGPGLDDAAASLDRMLYSGAAEGDRVITLAAVEVKPRVTTEMLQGLDVDACLGRYQTEFESSDERINNIRVATSSINGTVLDPGETFSFNSVVGERTVERGYMTAGALVASEMVDEVGGGICQVATTVFNAAYEAGLPIDERHNHSRYLSHYPTGRDAAVNWPDLDLRFTNDTEHPIYVQATSTSNSVTISLWGIRTGRTVETETGELQTTEEYGTTTILDSSLPEGYEEVTTGGINGLAVDVVRTVYEADGSVRSEEVFSSNYPARNKVITKGSKSSDS